MKKQNFQKVIYYNNLNFVDCNQQKKKKKLLKKVDSQREICKLCLMYPLTYELKSKNLSSSI